MGTNPRPNPIPHPHPSDALFRTRLGPCPDSDRRFAEGRP